MTDEIRSAIKTMTDEELKQYRSFVNESMWALEEDLERLQTWWTEVDREIDDREIKSANPEWYYGMELGNDRFLNRGPRENYHGKIVWGVRCERHGVWCGQDFVDGETVRAERERWLEDQKETANEH